MDPEKAFLFLATGATDWKPSRVKQTRHGFDPGLRSDPNATRAVLMLFRGMLLHAKVENSITATWKKSVGESPLKCWLNIMTGPSFSLKTIMQNTAIGKELLCFLNNTSFLNFMV